VSALACLGRRTLTGVIAASGGQFRDWSADYRLFARDRFRAEELFAVARREVAGASTAQAPLVCALDDSYLPKVGRKTCAVGFCRDSHAPPYLTNLLRAQRFVQLSAILPAGMRPCAARGVPVDLVLAPSPERPRRAAPPEEWQRYEAEKAAANVNLVGGARIAALRRALDADPAGEERRLLVACDGRFTNGTVLRGLPERTTLIGRVRRDTALCHLPEAGSGAGRPRSYGRRAPTPEELASDEAVPWQRVRVHAAGRVHEMRVKALGPLRWRAAGAAHAFRLLVVAPLAYRHNQSGKILYRKPAYLLCSDPALPLEELLQAYVWRWEIEVNFRDEKQLLGAGEAQVRTWPAVERVPQLIVAAYALLLLAARRTYGAAGCPETLPPPRWRAHRPPPRATTASLIAQLRAELWGQALGVPRFSGFCSGQAPDQKPKKLAPSLPSAVLYAAA
jgi:hypothetical protein